MHGHDPSSQCGVGREKAVVDEQMAAGHEHSESFDKLHNFPERG